MSAIPLARYLVEFGSDGDSGAGRAVAGAPASPRLSPQEIEAKVAESYARGLQDGTAAGEAGCASRLEAQGQAFELKLASERQAWSRHEGAMLAERLQAGLRAIETDIGNAAGRILQPFLVAALRRQALDELRLTLEALLTGQPAARVEISGPEDLVDALRAELAGKVPDAAFTCSETRDVRISIDHTVLETSLGAWMKKIEEAVG